MLSTQVLNKSINQNDTWHKIKLQLKPTSKKKKKLQLKTNLEYIL